MEKDNFEKYFFLLLIVFPVSIIFGATISLINLLIIDIVFLYFLIIQRNWIFFRHYSIKLLIVLYLYLIFNTFISLNSEIGIARNLGFLRLIIFFVFMNYYFHYFNKKNFLNFWTIVLIIFVIDVFIEFFVGTNIFGWGAREIDGVPQPNGRRVVSFFKDEPVAGAFLSGFSFLLFGNLLKKFSNKKIIPFAFLAVFSLAVLFTGERANTIKIFFGIIIFYLFLDFYGIKKKLISLGLILSLIAVILFKSDYLNNRYVGQIVKYFNSIDKLKIAYDQNIYLKLYRSGYSVFEKYPLFGVGNKNYRLETCKTENLKKYDEYHCMTHPHQIYFEFLSEHGLFGTTILLSIFFFMIYKILREIIKSRNYLQIGAFIYVLINFLPILPSGSFFSHFGITLFWINFSIMFACNKNTNIFSIK